MTLLFGVITVMSIGWQDCYDYESYSNSTDLPSDLYSGFGSTCEGESYSLTEQMPYWFQNHTGTPEPEKDTHAFPKDYWPNAYQAYFLGDENSPGWEGMYVRYGPDWIADQFLYGFQEAQWCSSNQQGWKYVNQPLPNRWSKRALTESETQLFNQTFAFLQDQINAARAQGLTGQEAIDFIATAECESSPPLEITPTLEAWIRMSGEPITAYDRICDNSSARFCAAFPNSDLCIEQEEEEEEQALIIEDRTLEVIAIAEGVVIVILLIFGILTCFQQQSIIQVDDAAYVQMDSKY